ncbi:MAG: ABC transporter permease, partial [Acidimicrobiales bacterium]
MTGTAIADPELGGEEPDSSESSALAAGLWGLRLPIVAVLLAAVTGGVLLLVSGENPLAVYWSILDESFFSASGIGRTLEKATPLVMGGLAVAFAFKAGLFNIGGQGQLLLGAAFAAWVGYNFDLPMVIHLPLALVVGGSVAALLGAVVGALKAYRGAHEVITTIM